MANEVASSNIIILVVNILIGVSTIALNIFGQLFKLPSIIYDEHSRENLDSKKEAAITFVIKIIRAKTRDTGTYEAIRTSALSFFEYIGRMLEILSLYQEEKFHYENYTTQKMVTMIFILLLLNGLVFILGLIFPNELIIISFCLNLVILIVLFTMISFLYYRRNSILKHLNQYHQKWNSFEIQYRRLSDLYLTIKEEETDEG